MVDDVALSSRLNMLMERVQWQNTQQERLVNELRRLRGVSEKLLYDKEMLVQRVEELEATKNELISKVVRYQMDLSRQAEVVRKFSVNQSIIHYLETCDASAMEEEIQNPRELIMALKKACKFRHDQYEKVVKEKLHLKEMLRSVHPRLTHQQIDGNISMARNKAQSASSMAFENKSASPTFTEQIVVESKKRKIESTSISASAMLLRKQQVNDEDLKFPHQFEPVGSRAVAYSDVPLRPPASSRDVFGHSNFNSSGVFHLKPSSCPPLQNLVPHATVCRHGHDETGKLTNSFWLKEDDTRSGSRKKSIPSMQHLLNAQSRTASQQQDHIVNNDRQQYALTNWLRNN
ncbi:hypothetical protein PPTG_13607 [Plasmopara halstedii]|uniref:Uncharacterized protein n=1 Tax=Plasmopara halstedii TaxID=4781 RepID=A0A0P1AMF0_PLAHL|nr:hypothetical protein PPTG_13607 [Plasmopara halstedii]CEG42110.1 hypothetical protein PPTG_13607 [Plasmopara halstedii]|eukprot:XP_024578479.1 hypothetical protein PPTG_13607 [Plasmopara halstedii]